MVSPPLSQLIICWQKRPTRGFRKEVANVPGSEIPETKWQQFASRKFAIRHTVDGRYPAPPNMHETL